MLQIGDDSLGVVLFKVVRHNHTFGTKELNAERDFEENKVFDEFEVSFVLAKPSNFRYWSFFFFCLKRDIHNAAIYHLLFIFKHVIMLFNSNIKYETLDFA